MIGLDTNVLVRYLAQDDPKQSRQAALLIESLTPANPGFVSTVALVEALWVMEVAYGAARTRLAEIVEVLLQTDALIVEAAELVWRALYSYRSGKADFSDHLIHQVGKAAGCEFTATFDRAAARDGIMTLAD